MQLWEVWGVFFTYLEILSLDNVRENLTLVVVIYIVIFTLASLQIVPSQVTGVQYTLDNNNNVLTMTVTWNRPSSDVVITHYEVLYSEDDTSQSTLRANTEQVMITGTVGKSYRIRVRAVSAVGTGEQSKSITIGRKCLNHVYYYKS